MSAPKNRNKAVQLLVLIQQPKGYTAKTAEILLASPRWSQNDCCSSNYHIYNPGKKKKGDMVSIRKASIFQKFLADFFLCLIDGVKCLGLTSK